MRSGFGFLKSSALSRVALVAAVGGALGACSSDTARFSENPFSNPFSSRQAAAVDRAPTGSVNRAVTQGYGVAPPVGQVTSQRLAPPQAQPMLQAAQAAPRSVPAAASTMVTGSIPQQAAAAPSAVALATAAPVAATARAAGGWSAAGGSPVTVGAGDTINSISSRYGVPASALAAANGVPANSRLQPGSQLIIPVFNQGGASTAMMAAPAAAAAAPALTPAPVRQVAQAAQTVSDVPRQPLYSQRQQPAPAAPPVASLPRAAAPAPAPAARAVANAPAQPPRPPAPVAAAAPPPAPAPVAAPRAVQTPAVDAARERARQQAEAARARAESVRPPAPAVAAATPAAAARPAPPAPVQTTRPAANPNADAEARIRAAEARAKAETERRQQAEARLKAEEERKAKAEAQAKARTEAQAKAKAEAERKQQAESRPRAETPAPRAAQQTGPGASANTTASLPAREEAKPAQPTADFRWPARGRVISGFTGRGGNEGINISVPEGTPVRAAEGGTVAYAGNELKGYGNLVLIRHDNGYVSAYAHNGELNVKRGERVGRGQVIARSGQSGNVSSPQLHFELRRGANPVDPMPYLNN